MLLATPCPNPQRLHLLALGESSAPERDAFAVHLEQCPECAAQVEAILQSDALVALVRVAGAEGGGVAVAAAVQQHMEQLERLPIAAAESATGLSTLYPDQTPAPLPSVGNFAFLAPPQAADELGRLAHYRVLQRLGAGGMGIVFRAEDTVLRRHVALKLMRPEYAAHPDARHRFLREAQAMAALSSEHIVKVFQAGEVGGVAYLTMELLPGTTLEERLNCGEALPEAEVLRIGREIAEGLAAAHAQGLIHRDVKPANVWLETRSDGKPARVKLLDFGLARAVEEDARGTKSGAILGTPAYMAPEQAESKPVDARCDLFSLGCVLYRMATGTLPFSGEQPLQVLRSILLDEPQAPRLRNPRVSPALSQLIMRLVAKHPTDRPPSAQAVVEELRVLETPPLAPAMLVPVPPSVGNERKQAITTDPRRLRRTPSVAIAAGVLVLAGAVGALLLYLMIPQQVEPPPENPPFAVKPSNSVLVSKPAPLKDVIWWTPETKAHRGGASVVAYSPNGKWLATAGGPDQTLRLWDTKTGGLVRILTGVEGSAVLAWSPDSKRLAWGSDAMRIYEADTGKALYEFKGHAGRLLAVAWSPDGKRLAVGGSDRVVRVWDADKGEQLPTLRQDCLQPVLWLGWSFDGKILSGMVQEKIFLWQGATGKLVKEIKWTGLRPVWSPKETLLALVTGKGIQIHDDKGQCVQEIKAALGVLIAWSPDGKDLIGHLHPHPLLHVLNATTGEFKQEIKIPEGIQGLDWSSDGKTLATAHGQQGIYQYSLEPGKQMPSPANQYMVCQSVAWSPGGKFLATGHQDDTARLWDIKSGKMLHPFGGGQGRTVSFPSDDSLLATGGKGNTVNDPPFIRLWDTATGVKKHEVPTSTPYVFWLDGGKTLAASSWPGYPKLTYWDVATAKEIPGRSFKSGKSPNPSPNGKWVAWQSTVGNILRVLLTDAHTGKEVPGEKLKARYFSFDLHPNLVFAWSPDGKRLAIGHHHVEIWDVAADKQLHKLEVQSGVKALAWSPDGKTLAVGTNVLQLWESDSGKLQRTWSVSWLNAALAWSPDSKHIACGGADNALRVWERTTGQLTATMLVLDERQCLVISPEGNYRGTPNIEEELCVVAWTEAGQELLTTGEFAKKYGWKNDPNQVKLMGK